MICQRQVPRDSHYFCVSVSPLPSPADWLWFRSKRISQTPAPHYPDLRHCKYCSFPHTIQIFYSVASRQGNPSIQPLLEMPEQAGRTEPVNIMWDRESLNIDTSLPTARRRTSAAIPGPIKPSTYTPSTYTYSYSRKYLSGVEQFFFYLLPFLPCMGIRSIEYSIILEGTR